MLVTLKTVIIIETMGVEKGGRGAVAPWVFINDTDKVEGGLMVLLFGLVFPLAPPWKFFCRRP